MKIESFSMTFTVQDNAEFIKNLDMYAKKVGDLMRDEGYSPVIELEPQLETKYNQDKANFDMELTLFGMYVGEKSWDMEATSINKTTQRYILPNK